MMFSGVVGWDALLREFTDTAQRDGSYGTAGFTAQQAALFRAYANTAEPMSDSFGMVNTAYCAYCGSMYVTLSARRCVSCGAPRRSR